LSLPQIAIAAFERAFNQFIALDPEASGQLAALEGHVICLEITGLNIRLYLFPSADDVMILDQFDADADTTISGSPLALLRLGLSSNAQAEMFEGDVKITGDLRLGSKFNRMLASLDIDWEELAAKGMGDMAARSLGNLTRGLFAWQQRTTESMLLNTGEYLQEEIDYLPSRNETQAFMTDVDKLRDGVARVEARIKRLQTNKENNKNNTPLANKKGTD
jgi:ubiquinone biosynthesis protein UbiJ